MKKNVLKYLKMKKNVFKCFKMKKNVLKYFKMKENVFKCFKMKENVNFSSQIKSFGGASDGLSVRGASHIKHNKVCQDYGGHLRDNDYAVAVVCDGHGGDAYIRSDRGSKFCVEITLDAVKEFLQKKQQLVELLSDISETDDRYKEKRQALINPLLKTIIARWNEKVIEDMRANPFTEDEVAGLSDKYKARYMGNDENDKISVYGTTLIAVVYTPEFWFGIRNGDGKCMSVSKDGSIDDPIPWNEKCFLNGTTSMCDEKAFENFRQCIHTDNFPAAIYVGTDGIDDSWGNDERLRNFYKNVTLTFAQSGFEAAKRELSEYLPKLTAQGSGDDVSISGIIDMEAIQGLFKEEQLKKPEDAELKEKTEQTTESADTEQIIINDIKTESEQQ